MRIVSYLCGSAIAISAITFAPAPAVAASAINPLPRQLASCYYDRHGSDVRELLGSQNASAAAEAYRQLSLETKCFDRLVDNQRVSQAEIVSAQPILRGMLAETAIEHDRAAAAALQPLPLQQKRYLRPWFAATNRNPAVDEMAACIADTNPAGILALLGSAPGSGDESSAIGGLNASLHQCLSAGTRLQADRASLRAALADALYQRMTNPGLSTPSESAAK